VDSEGGVQAKVSKTRFVAPVISLMVASRAADNDAGHHHDTSANGGDTNVSGRTLGGGLGFGMLGTAISQSSPYVGMALGYYGLAWSVYSGVIARGGEVEFEKNAMMDIKFVRGMWGRRQRHLKVSDSCDPQTIGQSAIQLAELSVAARPSANPSGRYTQWEKIR
jgi:hypothetical protein